MSSEPINRVWYDHAVQTQRLSYRLVRRGHGEIEAKISHYEHEIQDSLAMLEQATPGMGHYDDEVWRHDTALAVVTAAREQLHERAQKLAESAIGRGARTLEAPVQAPRSRDGQLRSLDK